VQTREIATNPLTIYWRDKEGKTLTGWARVNSESAKMVNHVVNAGYFAPKIVKKLREQGYYRRLPRIVREKIEEKELKISNRRSGLLRQEPTNV